MIIIHILIPILVGAYLYYELIIKKSRERGNKETFTGEESSTSTTSTTTTTTTTTTIPTSDSKIYEYLNEQFSENGLNFRALDNCNSFSEDDINYCISKDLGNINEHTTNSEISTGSAVYLNSNLVLNLPIGEYIYLIFPGNQPSGCYYPQKADGPGCGQFQLCGSNNAANIANYYLNGNKCRLNADKQDVFKETYQIISDGNAGSKINQNELVWANSTDVLAIGFLNDLRSPMTTIEINNNKDKAVLMQTLIKNDASLKKRTIPVVQIKINTDSTLTFAGYSDL
jgi:hypothetical protein